MDKRVVIIFVVIVVLVAAIGGAVYFLNFQSASLPSPTPVATATPVVSTKSQPALTASSLTPLTNGQLGTIDIYLDTKSAQIDGFQFIATLAGNSLPTIPDSDPVADGVQIQAATIPELSISTNSVTAQDGTFVVRFAMVATDSSTGFESSGPVKIASIPISTGSTGSVTLAFNQQNSRVRLTAGGDDALLGVTDASIPVSGGLAQSASTSGSLAAAPTALPQTAAATSAFCLASCFTDSDCAAGFVCETDRCVNPACPTSQTCGCGSTQGASPVATTVPVATPVVPVSTVTPTIKPSPTIVAVASSSATLPAAGAFEYTMLTFGAGLLLIGSGIYLTAKQEA